jgi:transposase
VQDLHAQGVPLLRIAKQLGLSRTTVGTFAAASTFPERAKHRALPSLLDPYISYLRQRLDAGCENASQLWREIHVQGFTGTRKQVARWVQQRRTEPARTGSKRQRQTPLAMLQQGATAATTVEAATLAAPRQLVWLLLRDQADLDSDEQATFARIQQHPTITLVYDLTKQFQAMVRNRVADHLAPWLTVCAASDVADLQTFAAGLERDYAAIRAALTEPWSNGQTEGQVTRLKLVKRQMYGRAKFDLLRQRVLHAV